MKTCESIQHTGKEKYTVIFTNPNSVIRWCVNELSIL